MIGELAVAGGGALSLVGGNLTNLSGGTLLAEATFVVGAAEHLQLPNNQAIVTLDATIDLNGAGAAVQSLNTTTGHQVALAASLTHVGEFGMSSRSPPGEIRLFLNAIANDGFDREAMGGTVSIAGAVSGFGAVEIGGGGSVTIAGAFSENVTFTAGKGELALSKSQGYAGTISGFSKTGADTLDLRDIGFISGTTKASFVGTTSGGVLTVTDGKPHRQHQSGR